MSSTDTVEVEVTFLRVTTAAVLVEYDEIEIWLPREHVEYDGLLDHCERSELVELRVPEWLAFDRGLI